MSDRKVEKLKMDGDISCWQYKDNIRNYGGWNFFSNTKGIESLISLLNLMQDAQYSSTKTLPLKSVPQKALKSAKNLNGSARFYSANYLTIKATKNEKPEFLFQANTDSEAKHLVLSINPYYLKKLISALVSYSNGEYDFGVGNDDGENYFVFWH